jgi:hypothetical protein
MLEAYLLDADVIWFVSLREQNLCWLIHGTKMIHETAAPTLKYLLHKKEVQMNNTVCLQTRSAFFSTL